MGRAGELSEEWVRKSTASAKWRSGLAKGPETSAMPVKNPREKRTAWKAQPGLPPGIFDS